MTTLLQQSVTPVANTRVAAPAVGRPWAGPIIAVAWLGLLVMGSAQAIDIPALPVVQPNIAAVNPALVQLRETLIKERKALLDRTNRHNSVCSAVVVGSAAHASCTQAYPLLEAEINSHIQASKQYNDNYLAAVNLAASQKPAPSSDPMVVDARGVPKDGAYLTAQVPELARSPAADRINKGFQAVINHDWPVALAWWQDALQRDPQNAALKRSVELAQWMVDRRKAAAAGPVPPLSLAIQAASRGDNAEAIRQFESAKADNPASAPYVDSMIATIRQKSAQKVKQAAISAEITKQQISLVGKLNDEGLKMLMVGKDMEAQRLFNDAQFFSMGLSPEQVKSYDSPYFGSANATPAKQSSSQPRSAKAKP